MEEVMPKFLCKISIRHSKVEMGRKKSKHNHQNTQKNLKPTNHNKENPTATIQSLGYNNNNKKIHWTSTLIAIKNKVLEGRKKVITFLCSVHTPILLSGGGRK